MAEHLAQWDYVLPAQAGVIPGAARLRVDWCGAPRAGGGDPSVRRARMRAFRCSPRRRG